MQSLDLEDVVFCITTREVGDLLGNPRLNEGLDLQQEGLTVEAATHDTTDDGGEVNRRSQMVLSEEVGLFML